MVFRYYIPATKAADVTAELLERLGLAERLWDCLPPGVPLKRHLAVNDVLSKGPDGSSGALIVPLPPDGERVPRLGWYAEQQTALERAGYWIISDNEHPPTPAGLARREQQAGYIRRLGDAREWHCPTLRSEIEKSDLPREYLLDADGGIVTVIQARYRKLWMRSLNWCLRFLDQCHDLPAVRYLGVDEAVDGAMECLALNYRVSREELSLIPGLLTDQAITAVLDAAIDWDLFAGARGLEKKTEQADSLERCSAFMAQLLSGPEDSTAATDPAGPPSNSSAAATSATTPSPSSPPSPSEGV